MELESVNKTLKSNFRVLVIPLFVSLALIVLFVLLGKFGYSKVMSQITELESAQKTEKALEGKLAVLQRIETGLENSSDKVALALPARNPAPFSLSNIKANASSNFVVITDVSMASTSSEDPTSVDISLSITADSLANFLEYFKSFENVSPITSLESVEFAGSDGTELGARLSLASYWSPFPSTIPSVTEAVYELTPAEQELMDKVTRLSNPSFQTLLPSQPSDRDNPFN